MTDEERLEQIRLVEKEIEELRFAEDGFFTDRAYSGILAREQAALTELKRGLRPESRREQ